MAHYIETKESNSSYTGPHRGRNIGEWMFDQWKCSCGWKSHNYFDGADFAEEEFQKHVKAVETPEKAPETVSA